MAYTEPVRVSYTRTLGTSNVTWAVSPPPGKTQMRVADIQASVSTTFTNTTTSAKLTVGVTNNLAVAGSLDLGVTAAGSTVGLGSQFIKGTNPLVPVIDLSGTANPVAVTSPYPAAIEVLGPVLITYLAPTGGTPAGAAISEITLAWF